ncbi:MAG: hypothetical protein C0417_10735 [Chlorobiaceae bacterium]|nr:hypothetical protein [Chlorobiaceae bacterium]
MSQLYLNKNLRSKLKSQIKMFCDYFITHLFPTFDNIEQTAYKYANDVYAALMKQFAGPDEDGSSVADTAIEHGLNHYTALASIRYSFSALALASLYHLWEQQAREFLFNELSRDQHIPPDKFCPNGLEGIKEIFLKYGVDLTTFKSWSQLNELRIICNVVKHGDGKSANELRGLKPKLFNPDVYRSTTSSLFEDILLVSSKEFVEYADMLIAFWDEIPEHDICP